MTPHEKISTTYLEKKIPLDSNWRDTAEQNPTTLLPGLENDWNDFLFFFFLSFFSKPFKRASVSVMLVMSKMRGSVLVWQVRQKPPWCCKSWWPTSQCRSCPCPWRTVWPRLRSPHAARRDRPCCQPGIREGEGVAVTTCSIIGN